MVLIGLLTTPMVLGPFSKSRTTDQLEYRGSHPGISPLQLRQHRTKADVHGRDKGEESFVVEFYCESVLTSWSTRSVSQLY